MKKILKWSFRSVIIIYLLIIIFPQFLFENKFEYKNFTVYFNSNDINRQDLKKVLDKSLILLNKTELYNKEIKQDIFICNSFNEFTFFSPMGRKSFAANYFIIQNIFLSKSSISDDIILRNDSTNNKRTLSGVIAHETTHSLLENKLGTLKYKLLPLWKNEGYCDYIANESSFNRKTGIRYICNDDEMLEISSFQYFKYRLFSEYLFIEKKVSLDFFLINDFKIEDLNQKLKYIYCK